MIYKMVYKDTGCDYWKNNLPGILWKNVKYLLRVENKESLSSHVITGNFLWLEPQLQLICENLPTLGDQALQIRIDFKDHKSVDIVLVKERGRGRFKESKGKSYHHQKKFSGELYHTYFRIKDDFCSLSICETLPWAEFVKEAKPQFKTPLEIELCLKTPNSSSSHS